LPESFAFTKAKAFMFFSSILQNSSEETSLDCRMNLYNSASDILNFDAETS